MAPTTDPSDRFWSQVDDLGGPKACWLWTKRLSHEGYGRLKRPDRYRDAYAHRVAWELTFGPIPDGLFVLHRCDNFNCVNARAHLFLGTPADHVRNTMAIRKPE